MSKLRDNFVTLDDGRIRHMIYHVDWQKKLRKFAQPFVQSICSIAGIKKTLEKMEQQKAKERSKEIGYQSFTIYAFPMFPDTFQNDPVFTSEPLREAVSYLETQSFKSEVFENLYSYGYNPSDFEVPLCLSKFSTMERKDILREVKYWMRRQLSSTYNPNTGMFDRNTDDPETLTAKLYQCTRLPEDVLFLDVAVAEDRDETP